MNRHNDKKWRGYSYKELIQRKQIKELEVQLISEKIRAYRSAMQLAAAAFSIFDTIKAVKSFGILDYATMGIQTFRKLWGLYRRPKESRETED